MRNIPVFGTGTAPAEQGFALDIAFPPTERDEATGPVWMRKAMSLYQYARIILKKEKSDSVHAMTWGNGLTFSQLVNFTNVIVIWTISAYNNFIIHPNGLDYPQS